MRALIPALLISLPTLAHADMRPLARCLHDSLYPVPAVFPGAAGSQWHEDGDTIRLTWLGPDFLAKGRLIPYAHIAFTPDGATTVDVPMPDNPADLAVVTLAEPRRTVERRLSWCQARLSVQVPGS